MATGWQVWECAVFAIFVCATSCAPLWRRRKDKADPGGSAKQSYIFATAGVSTISMILSVSRGTLGVRSFLGYPSELVYRGSAMWETLYGMALAFPVVCWVFVPIYWRLHTNSVYEYLEMRFKSHWIRRMAAGTFIARQVLNLAVTVFTPTVALHAVLGLPHWASAAALTIVAIVFNLLGGLAAAIRADVIQTVTMVLVSGVFIVQATLRAGGPAKVIQENISGERLNFFEFTWDPTVRVDTLSALIGQLFMSISVYGCQQTFVQRYCSMKSEARVRRTLLSNIPAVAILFSLSWIVGMCLYALYKYCDPLLTGKISAPDEILPYFVLDQFTIMPGMLGLFLGSLFNGALSFLVSNVNSLATVTWEDFVSTAPVFAGTSDKQQLTVIKVIAVAYGILIMCLSLGVGLVGGVVEGSLLVTSATSGALLGVFLLAALFPVANGKGALTGMITSHIVTTWLAVGRLLYVNKKSNILPILDSACSNLTTNSFINRPLLINVNQTLLPIVPYLNRYNTSEPSLFYKTESLLANTLISIYSVSYMWYAVIGTTLCIFLGVIVGYLTNDERDAFDERLLHPLAAKIARKLPGKKRTFKTHICDEKPTKESSEKTEETVTDISVTAVQPPAQIFTTVNSRLFDAYGGKNPSSPVMSEKTRL